MYSGADIGLTHQAQHTPGASCRPYAYLQVSPFDSTNSRSLSSRFSDSSMLLPDTRGTPPGLTVELGAGEAPGWAAGAPSTGVAAAMTCDVNAISGRQLTTSFYGLYRSAW